MDLCKLSLQEAKELLAKGETTAVELTAAVLSRIEAIDGRLKSFISLGAEAALEQAATADQQRRAGKGGVLCGLPLAIKDVLCTADLPTTCGSRILENFRPPYDATAVTALRNAGAVIVGKTAMDEFAMGSTSETCAYGVPENPWKPGYVAGGSSGGSATAVAADECLASLGTDTGGSIRQPASFCGIVGLKPTYGRVSRYGLVSYGSSLDCIGPMTKDVADCALLLEVIAGYDPRDSTSVNRPVPNYSAALRDGLQGVRVGIPREYFVAALHPEVKAQVEAGIAMLKEAGAEIVEVSLPLTEYCVATYYMIASAEASSNLARYDGVKFGYRADHADSLPEMYLQSRAQGFGEEVKRRILIGTFALSSGYYDAYYQKASQVRTLIREDFAKVFTQCDVLASAVSPIPAWRIGEKNKNPLEMYLADILTISANLAGIPGISVPVGFTGDGLPIGLQLQATHFNETLLLHAAHNLEQRAGVLGKKPTVA